MPNTFHAYEAYEHARDFFIKWRRRSVEYIKRALHEHCTKYPDENSQDRAARRTAIATIWIAIFTVVTACVGIKTYLSIDGQLRVMKDQLDEMRGEQRPWIGPPRLEFQRQVGTHYIFTIIFSNSGKTPTLGLSTQSNFVSNVSEVAPAIDHMCERTKGNEEQFRHFTIFPGGQLKFDDRRVTSGMRTTLVRDGNKKYWLAGCVAYGIPGDKKRHMTKFYGPIDLDSERPGASWIWAIDAN